MKRITLVVVATLFAVFYPFGAAYAQHPHPGGAGMSGMHGSSSTHSSSISASHSSKTMASTNPGGVLDHNSNLSTKLEGLLGLSGPNALQTLKTDASGFKSFGQFVAAVHVSNNLDIPFSQLQAKMTGPNAVSLGKAVQELKPSANSKTEAKKGMKQAHQDVEQSS